MSIKPFYVYKPTRKEAIEIVERAAANGAKCEHAVAGMDIEPNDEFCDYDECEFWGVDDKNRIVQWADDYDYGAGSSKLTMQQVRETLPCEKHDGVKQEWNGEGLPPVGTVCEGLLQVEAGYPKWVKVEILKIVNGRCAVYRDDYDMLKWCDEFRTLRTKRDKWIETASKLFHDADGGVPTDAAFGAIYDKLIAKDAEE